MALDVTEVREDFPIFSRQMNGVPLVYLDNGATTHKPRAVLDAITGFYSQHNSNVGRSMHGLSAEANTAYERARGTVARFIHAQHLSEVVFTKSTTESINMVAASLGETLLRPGDEVLLTEVEHHANLIPWQAICRRVGARLRFAPVDERGNVDAEAVIASMNERTKIASMAHVSNVLGTVLDLSPILAECRRREIVSVVDGAQAIAHEPVNVQALGCDFYAFSGHKIYGPMGIGVLYGRQERLEMLTPWLRGGGGVTAVTFEDVVSYKPLPYRLETGTPNVGGAVGLAAAIEYLSALDLSRVHAHEREVLEYACETLPQIDGVRLIGPPRRRSAILSFTRENFHAYDLGARASACGVALSAGAHCAMPLLDKMNLVATVRIALAVYNSREDIDVLSESMATAERGVWSLERPLARF